jgi:hypothetical protein
MSSLLKKPERKGKPERARDPTMKVTAVHRILPKSFPWRVMSTSPPTACITLPEPRKRRALKKAWVKRWKMAAT